MTTKTTNRVNSINSTTGYCDLNVSATAGITNFATVVGQVKAKMVLINTLNQVGSGTSKGVTTDTNLLRKTMTDLALKCANGTMAYANSVNNNTLKALVNFTESKLNKAKKQDVDDLCMGIHDATNANIGALAGFGVTATDVSDLAAAIVLYRLATQNPRQAIITKSQANKQAEQMVREVMDDLLTGQLDLLANTLKLTNNNFWSGYKQAREILDLGTTTAKIRGWVKNVNDVPLVGVVFTIYAKGTMNIIAQTTTDVKGRFRATELPEGDVDLLWEFTGYEKVVEPNVHITAGKELQRKVVMKNTV